MKETFPQLKRNKPKAISTKKNYKMATQTFSPLKQVQGVIVHGISKACK